MFKENIVIFKINMKLICFKYSKNKVFCKIERILFFVVDNIFFLKIWIGKFKFLENR